MAWKLTLEDITAHPIYLDGAVAEAEHMLTEAGISPDRYSVELVGETMTVTAPHVLYLGDLAARLCNGPQFKRMTIEQTE